MLMKTVPCTSPAAFKYALAPALKMHHVLSAHDCWVTQSSQDAEISFFPTINSNLLKLKMENMFMERTRCQHFKVDNSTLTCQIPEVDLSPSNGNFQDEYEAVMGQRELQHSPQHMRFGPSSDLAHTQQPVHNIVTS